MSAEFYLTHKRRFIRDHAQIMRLAQPLLEKRYGQESARDVIRRSEVSYEALLIDMPYIGGWENPLTDTLTQVSSFLALYFVLKENRKPVEEIGELIHRICDRKVETTPALLRKMLGVLYMSSFWRKRSKAKALITQKREFSGNFVFEVVEGGNSSSWGINYLECAIVKFFHQQGADELSPYMCYVDYILFPAMGIDLKRTGTIGQGCAHCDFRFHKIKQS